MSLPTSEVGNNGQPQSTPEAATPNPVERPGIIPKEQSEDHITPRAGGPLIIPKADLELDDEEEIEAAAEKLVIANPSRNMWILLLSAIWCKVKLWKYQPESGDKPNQKSQKPKWFYVDKPLQARVKSELCYAHVLPYLSTETGICRLWLIRVTVGNSWFESLHSKILCQSPEFFENYEICVQSRDSDYRVMRRPRTHNHPWPDKPANELLTEALTPDYIITSETHPFYANLVAGEEVR
jgi:hypothetical protein